MKQFMQGAIDQLGNVKPRNWAQPSDIKTASAYVFTSRYLGQVVPSPSTDIYPSWYVGGNKGGNHSAATDKVSGKLATTCTPALARESGSSGNTDTWNVDLFVNNGTPNITGSTNTNSGPQQTDDVHSCNTDEQPTATITAINGVPTGGTSTLSCPATGSCNALIHVEQGTHPLTDSNYPDFPGTLNLVVNGQTVDTQAVNDNGDYQLTYTPAPGTTGSVQIEAQVIDSVLYSGTDTQTVNIQTTNSFLRAPTIGGAGSGSGGKEGKLTSVRR
jgi:hypothetical protein